MVLLSSHLCLQRSASPLSTMSETEPSSLPPQPLTKRQKQRQRQKLKRKAAESEVPAEEGVVQAESEVPAEEDVIIPSDTSPVPSPSSTPPPAPAKPKKKKKKKAVSKDVPSRPESVAASQAASPMSVSASLPADPVEPAEPVELPKEKKKKKRKGKATAIPAMVVAENENEDETVAERDQRLMPDIEWSTSEPPVVTNKERLKAGCLLGFVYIKVKRIITMEELFQLFFGGE